MKKIIWIAIGIIVLVGVLVIVGSIKRQPDDRKNNAVVSLLSPEQKAADEKAAAEQAASVSSATEAGRYIHPTIGFSFEKPQGYTVGSVPSEDGSQTLIVQPGVGAGQNGFQIVITPLDKPMTLTAQLIKKELPETVITGAQNIVLDGKGKGLMFSSSNDAFDGASFEIWFIYPEFVEGRPSHLYQITSYAGFASQLQQIIGTWRF